MQYRDFHHKDKTVSHIMGIPLPRNMVFRYNDLIISAMASHIASLTIVYSSVYSGSNQRKHQSSASLAFVWGIHRSPVNSPHKGSVTRKILPFDDVIMLYWNRTQVAVVCINGRWLMAAVSDIAWWHIVLAIYNYALSASLSICRFHFPFSSTAVSIYVRARVCM